MLFAKYLRRPQSAASLLLLVFGCAGNDTTENDDEVSQITQAVFTSSFANVSAAPFTVSGNKDGGLAWADYNEDGCLDVAVNTNAAAQDSRLLTSDCAGGFVDDTAARISGFTATTINRQIFFADLNDDGYADLFRTDFVDAEVYFNSGPPGYTFGTGGAPSVAFADPNWPDGSDLNGEGGAAIDLDGDGVYEFLVENHNNGVKVFRQDGADGFTMDATTGLPGNGIGGDGDYLTVGDIDGDGDVDVLARKSAVSDLYINDGTGNFTVDGNFNVVAANGDKGGVAMCDVDDDGDLDILWTDNGANQIWRNDGVDAGLADGSLTWVATGQPETSSGVTMAGNMVSVHCGDIDNDGDLDLLWNRADGADYLFQNNGALSFTRLTAGGGFGFNNTADSRGAAFVDYDNDGDVDISINVNGGTNELWRNAHRQDGGTPGICASVANPAYANGATPYGATYQLFDEDNLALTGRRSIQNGQGYGSGGDDGGRLHLPLIDGITAEYNLTIQYPDATTTTHCFVPSVEAGANGCLEFAASSTCSDKDGDGVSDLFDLDCDNDGMLDDVESDAVFVDWDNATDDAAVILGSIDGNTLTLTNDSNIRDPSINPAKGAFPGDEGIHPAGSDFNSSEHLNIADSNGATYTINFGSATTADLFVHMTAMDNGVTFTNATIETVSGGFGVGTSTFTFNAFGMPFNDGGLTARIPAGTNVFAIDRNAGGDNLMFTITGISDTDGDGVENRCDLDSDNDGISDLYESGAAAALIAFDMDGNGSVSTIESGDGNGDGIIDVFTITGTIPVDSFDTEGDDLPDYLDLDSDDDGLPDATEGVSSANHIANDGNVIGEDLDGDGVIAAYDGNMVFGGTIGTFNAPNNDDSAGAPDYLSLDSDGDTLLDSVESGLGTTTTSATYPDPDGTINDPLGSATGLQNTDSDNMDVDFRSINVPCGNGSLDAG